MTYEAILAQLPPTTQAGNRAAAAEFVNLLTLQIKGAGVAGFSASQRNYLYKLKTKWELRALGKDPSWDKYGGRPGRRASTVPAKTSKVDLTVHGDEDEMDPLLLSLTRKYGTPRRTDDI